MGIACGNVDIAALVVLRRRTRQSWANLAEKCETTVRQRKGLGQAGGGLPSTGVQALSERPRQPP